MTIESFNKQYKYKKPMNCGKYERLFEIQWISPPGAMRLPRPRELQRMWTSRQL